MTLAAVVVVITLVTLGVGALGAGRIGKYRPALKSYDPAKSSDMGSSRDARMRLKTDSETASDLRGESHMRAQLEIGDHEPDVLAMLKRVCWMLFHLTGIPLLTGLAASTDTTTTSIMGNTAKPSLAVHELSHANNNVEVDPLRDSKAPITAAAQQQELEDKEPQWSDESDSESDASSSVVSEQEIEDKATALRSEIMLDGLQFYTAVAKLSVSTAHNVIDIGLFRATTIAMRERRKAMEDASILAIEASYPDIMCLPRFTSPSTKKLDVSETEDMSRTYIASPRAQVQLETGFLKAA